jgi:glycosyltransferase 2 family protein
MPDLPAGAVGRSNTRWIWLAVKLAVTAALVTWLLHDVGLSGLAEASQKVSLSALAVALAIQFLAYAVALWRWWLLLRYADVNVPYLSVKPAYYLGLFFNQLLPTGVGGDAVRTYHLYRKGIALRPLVGSALMDRLIGLFSMIYLAIGGLLVAQTFMLPADGRIALAAFAVAAILGFLVLFLPPTYDLLRRPLVRWQHLPVVGILSDILEICHSYGRAPALLSGALILSFLMQSMEVTIYMLLGHDLGLDMLVATYFAIVPLTFVAASLPISLGGLGVREGVFVGLMVTAGVDKSLAVALAVLFLAILWTSVLPGLWLFLRLKR